MKIYSFPTFNATKILLTAEELGLDYEFVMLDMAKGEHKSPEHLARNPLGKVPTLELEGQHYTESNAICRLLAELNGNRLYSADPKQAAVINGWMDMMAQHSGRWMAMQFFQEVIGPKLMNRETDPDQLEEANGFLAQQLPVIEQALSKHEYLAGNELTIADLVAFSYCNISEYTSLSFAEYPKIEAWYNAIRARPSFKAAMAHSEMGHLVPMPG